MRAHTAKLNQGCSKASNHGLSLPSPLNGFLPLAQKEWRQLAETRSQVDLLLRCLSLRVAATISGGETDRRSHAQLSQLVIGGSGKGERTVICSEHLDHCNIQVFIFRSSTLYFKNIIFTTLASLVDIGSVVNNTKGLSKVHWSGVQTESIGIVDLNPDSEHNKLCLLDVD